MKQYRYLPHLVIFIGLLWTAATPAQESAFDVVTMRNGEIHNGTLAKERFHLQTPYGEVAIPYREMRSLRRDHDNGVDHILTQSGDRFSGQLQDEGLTMLRVLDPYLILHSSDVMEVYFANRVRRRVKPETPDLVIAHNGDMFAARVVTSDFLLLRDDGIKLIKRDAMHDMDISTIDDGRQHRVQITQNSGATIQGKLSTKQIRLQPAFGRQIEVAIPQLSALVLRVNHSGRHSSPLYRQRFNPLDLIQDEMPDGTFGPRVLALRGGQTIRGDIQGDGDSDEKPPVTVTLKPFAIGLHEVTFAEYDLYCEAEGVDKPDDQDWGRGPRPVVNVSWEEARGYTEWLSRRTGQSYRLPTDAEWEYAARGGSGSKYWWGESLGQARANCDGCGSLWDGEKTAPVGRFEPNRFGLHDTAGNVFEWVEDCWNDSYADAPVDGSALNTAGCGKRVIRGGAWSFPPKEIRSANRWRDFPTRRSDDTGFRVVRDLN